uniref:Uncharacterized protein n=1 Tax=Aegilops tauschii TaxID=37682 RepID=M8CMA4_AEGTA
MEMVEKLSLTTRPHPHPYYIQWFNNNDKVKTHRDTFASISVLMHAMMDAKNLRPQHDRLLHLHHRLRRLLQAATPAPTDDAKLRVLATDPSRPTLCSNHLRSVFGHGTPPPAPRRPPPPPPPHPGGKHDTSSPDGKPKAPIDLDKAIDFLDRGCTILRLVIAVLSRKELANLAEFTEKVAYISEDGPYPSTD